MRRATSSGDPARRRSRAAPGSHTRQERLGLLLGEREASGDHRSGVVVAPAQTPPTIGTARGPAAARLVHRPAAIDRRAPAEQAFQPHARIHGEVDRDSHDVPFPDPWRPSMTTRVARPRSAPEAPPVPPEADKEDSLDGPVVLVAGATCRLSTAAGLSKVLWSDRTPAPSIPARGTFVPHRTGRCRSTVRSSCSPAPRSHRAEGHRPKAFAC